MEVRNVRFEYSKACRKLVEVQKVRLDYPKACMRLAEVQESALATAKSVGCL